MIASMNHKMDKLLEKSIVVVVSIEVGSIIPTKQIMGVVISREVGGIPTELIMVVVVST